MEAVRPLKRAIVALFPSQKPLLQDRIELEARADLLRAEVESCRRALEAHPGEISTALRAQRESITAREIQRAAATYHPLLTGDLVVEDERIEVRGIAIAAEGLTQSLAFFINGRHFDEVHYPVPDAHTRKFFSQIDGAGAGFLAVAKANIDELKRERFFCIDISATGAFVAQNWRHAMWFMNPAFEQFSMPPADHMRRVVGDDSPSRFGMGGATIFHSISAYLREMGRDWSEFRNVLDWGCGASVMTHLTEEMQFAWLEELRRITRPGALLFLSIQGPVQYAYLGIPASLMIETEERGFLDLRRDPALDGYIENADYYRSAWHSRGYVVKNWGRYFDVIAIIDGIAALQDFVVLRRRVD